MKPIRIEVIERLYATIEILNGKLSETDKREDISLIVDYIEDVSHLIKNFATETGE